jgi:hypothetical protein
MYATVSDEHSASLFRINVSRIISGYFCEVVWKCQLLMTLTYILLIQSYRTAEKKFVSTIT